MLDFELDSRLWGARSIVASCGNMECQIYIIQEGELPPTQHQLQVLESFMRLAEADVATDLADYALKYCEEVEELIDLKEEGIEIDKKNISNHFNVTTILIPELGDSDSAFVFLSADCEWEEEHGMQFLFENGKIIWCGDHGTLPFSPQWNSIITAESEEARHAILDRVLS
ncbi:hypothetical protein Mal35_20310 [Gimesia maris]|uniref:DUF6985 domain-containing protein n=1 Tax=Gimesia maris TaxID=122 RepID=UPI001189906E|nr:hypothetical protein [Gimesia maris]QDT78582.1 hypothetical protein Mal35_20310 [Gimesia maris]